MWNGHGRCYKAEGPITKLDVCAQTILQSDFSQYLQKERV